MVLPPELEASRLVSRFEASSIAEVCLPQLSRASYLRPSGARTSVQLSRCCIDRRAIEVLREARLVDARPDPEEIPRSFMVALSCNTAGLCSGKRFCVRGAMSVRSKGQSAALSVLVGGSWNLMR